MAVNSVITHTYDLETPLVITPLRHALATGDQLGDRFDITVTQKGLPADLTGAGVTGYFIRTADGATVVITGSASGNVASVTLPESCYAVPGRFTLTVKVSKGDVRHAVYVGEGAVLRSSTDTIIDPGREIPDLDELLAMIAQIESAAEAASAAASKANTAAAGADSAAGKADTAASAANTAANKLNNLTVSAHSADTASAAITEVSGHKNIDFGLPTGAAAGFGAITATVDNGVGTPSVQVTKGGPATATTLKFDFHNLKGIPGEGSVSTVWGAIPDETGDAKPEIGGTNLIPHSNIIYGGYYDNHGVFQKDDESLCCPEYIPVQYGEDLVYQVWQTDLSKKPWLSFTAYDSNKTFIPDSYVSLYGTQGNVHHMIIPTTWIPENAAYIRCSFGFGEGSRAKLEHGVVPTDWSPAPEDKQDKIDLIGGTNLLTGTKDFSQSGGNPQWEYVNVWEDNGTYNGLTVKRKNTRWSGIRQNFNAKAGEKYVFSCYINVDNPVNIAFCNVVNNGEANKVDKYGINIADQCKAGKWTRISVSFNVFEDCVLQTRVESNDEENGYIQICGYKLERGTVPTDWSPAPEDVYAQIDNIQVGGRNLIRDTGAPTIIGRADDNYYYRQFSFTVGTLTLGETYTISADVQVTEGIFDKISCGIFDESKKVIQAVLLEAPIENGKIRGTFKITGSDAVLLLIYAGQAGSTNGNSLTISNLKFERGTVPTDWSPAPENFLLEEDLGTYETGEEAKTAIFKWILDEGPTYTTKFAQIIANYSTDKSGTIGNLHDGTYWLMGAKARNYAVIYAMSYWRDRFLTIGIINNRQWIQPFTSITAKDVGAVSSAELTGLVEGILRNHGLIS